MVAKQLSIFLENKSGSLTQVTDVLGRASINLTAMSIADNSDFGILRCIVSDADAACHLLRQAGFAVQLTDVISFTCPNVPGALADVLKRVSSGGVFIEYLYSFECGDEAHIVMRPSDLELCAQLVNDALSA